MSRFWSPTSSCPFSSLIVLRRCWGDESIVGCCAGPSLYSSSGSGKGLAAELEHLRDAVRHKEDQIASLQDQLARLEATRDRWSSGMHWGHALCAGSARQSVVQEASKACMLHVYLNAPNQLGFAWPRLHPGSCFACRSMLEVACSLADGACCSLG